MPRTKSVQNPALLQAAIEGLEAQKQRLEQQIQEVKVLLGQGVVRRGRPPGSKAVAAKKAPRKPLSAAARKRIAAAQKRRWAEFRKSHPDGEEK
jgi:hypothetical protein